MQLGQCPPLSLAFLTVAVLLAVFVAGGLLAVFTYAIALELWIRFLVPDLGHVPLRHDDDREP